MTPLDSRTAFPTFALFRARLFRLYGTGVWLGMVFMIPGTAWGITNNRHSGLAIASVCDIVLFSEYRMIPTMLFRADST